MAGAYCRYCGRRCFVDRVLPDRTWWGHMATCPEGMARDRQVLGYDHTTAVNPLDTRTGAPSGKNARQSGAPNHHEDSKETSMVRPTLDDTLHAIVQLTHDHGLPLHGVSVDAGDVRVRGDVADLPHWVRWLTDPAQTISRSVTCWRASDGCGSGGEHVVVYVTAHRDGIDWTICPSVPAAVADAVLTEHDVTMTANHTPVPADVALALLEQHHQSAKAAA